MTYRDWLRGHVALFAWIILLDVVVLGVTRTVLGNEDDSAATIYGTASWTMGMCSGMALTYWLMWHPEVTGE